MPLLPQEHARGVGEAALKAQEQMSIRLESSVSSIVEATEVMETRVSRLELLLERIEKTSQGRASSEASERQVAKAAVSTLVRTSQPPVDCLSMIVLVLRLLVRLTGATDGASGVDGCRAEREPTRGAPRTGPHTPLSIDGVVCTALTEVCWGRWRRRLRT